MERGAAIVIAIVAAVIGAALSFQLLRQRRRGSHPWTAQEYLTALGLVVALLAVVLPIVFAERRPSQKETAYRQEVRAVCASLQPTSNPLMAAMQAGGTIRRDVLVQGLRDQVSGSGGVLADLWAQEPPSSLADAQARARDASDALLAASEAELERMQTGLPATTSFEAVMSRLGSMESRLRPAASQMERAMSQLAGAPCRPPDVSQPEP